MKLATCAAPRLLHVIPFTTQTHTLHPRDSAGQGQRGPLTADCKHASDGPGGGLRVKHIPQVDGGQRERKACSSVESRPTVTQTVGHTYTVCRYSVGIVLFYLFFKNVYLKNPQQQTISLLFYFFKTCIAFKIPSSFHLNAPLKLTRPQLECECPY